MSRLRTANLLGALAGAVVSRMDSRIGDHPNQTDTAAAALNLLALHDGCSLGNLGKALKLSHPAAVRLVDRLEAGGLVERRPGQDRRSVSLHLTAAGKARARDILAARCVALETLIERLPAHQRQQLDDIAEALLDQLTSTPIEGAYICRLCDEIACPADRCPVHLKAIRLMDQDHHR